MDNNDIFFGTDFLLEDEEEKLSLKEGELREVSVLFADIKGFTNISNLFAPEVIHGKMDEIMKIFTRCINFYGGFVDKYMGDGIMALFGAKKATEHDTQRAILSALKMQEQLRLYNGLLAREPGFESLELGLRIGINTGLVSVGKVGQSREGDFTVYGPEVNLASRMESNAPVNGIMLPLSTKRLVEHIFEFEHLGLKEVKGMDEPIDCWRVLAQKSEGNKPAGSVFIGREAELRLLQNAYQDMSFRIIGLKGDAGIGKSRLIQEFCSGVGEGVVLRGACSPISPSPFNLFTKIFEELFSVRHTLPSEQKKPLLESALRDLAERSPNPAIILDCLPLIGLLLDIRYDDSRVKQKGKDLLNHVMRAIELILMSLLHQAQGKTRILILDDIHLIDEASAMALCHLLSKIEAESIPLLMLVMYRLDYPILECVTRHPSFMEQELSPLSKDKIDELVGYYTRELNLSEATLKQVRELSAGNPFFLEEWCNYIANLPPSEQDDYPVPGNLHALILSRLDNLPQNLRMLLHKASVIGNEFFVDILREVEQRLNDPIDVDITLKGLEDHSLIMRMLGFDFSTYFFKHITTREVAYQTLLHQNRKMLHQLTAEAIESLFADRLNEFSYALADHYLRAEMPDKAKPYLHQAIDLATKVYDNALALKLCQDLLIILENAEEKADILIKSADIKWLTGKWPEADADIQAAETFCPPSAPLACDIHRFKGIAAFFKGDFETALIQFQTGYALAQTLEDPLQTCVALSNLGIWHQHHQKYEQAINYHQQSLKLAISLHEDQRQAKTLSNLGLIFLENKEHKKAEQAFAQSLKISETHRFLRDESIALGNLAFAYITTQQYDEALPLLNRKLTLATQMNDKLETIKALGNIGNIHKERKEYPEALSCYQKILSIKQTLGNQKEIENTLKTIEETEELMKVLGVRC